MISLKLESPTLVYFNNTITKTKKLTKKSAVFVFYSYFTYVFVITSTNILHCNVTKIKKYNQAHSSKKYQKLFSQS